MIGTRAMLKTRIIRNIETVVKCFEEVVIKVSLLLTGATFGANGRRSMRSGGLDSVDCVRLRVSE